MATEDPKQIAFPVMRITQPIGDFYVGKMSAADLIDISWFDIRRLRGDDEFEGYLGIQRRINEKRVAEISEYVKLQDATFPTAVILSVEGRSASLEPIDNHADFYQMRLQNTPGELDEESTVLFRGIARVLDGQHRIKGLKESDHDLSDFEINVCVFVDADIADQASIFATVNLAQTKVNRSLVYDLLSYSQTRSPERSCHIVTVTLDQSDKSPLHRRIKRLGVATNGRFGEVLTQATVVKSLLPYISTDPLKDRDIGKRFGHWNTRDLFDPERLIFRRWFIDEREDLIAEQLMHYFEAIRRRWPMAWEDLSPGNMLPRTNGFRAFMSFLRPAYNQLASESELVKMKQFLELFEATKLEDTDFNTETFLPGSSGERALFRRLMEDTDLGRYL